MTAQPPRPWASNKTVPIQQASAPGHDGAEKPKIAPHGAENGLSGHSEPTSTSAKARAMRRDRTSYEKIAAILHVSLETVMRYTRNMDDPGNFPAMQTGPRRVVTVQRSDGFSTAVARPMRVSLAKEPWLP